MQAGDNPGSADDSWGKDVVRGERELAPMLHEFPAIPQELEYLIEPAIHYGKKYRFDDAIQLFLKNAEELDFETLAALAERARLFSDYPRLMKWMNGIGDVLDRIVDERYPYTIDISEQQRRELLRLINEANDPPDVAERRREKRLRQLAEANDRSDIAACRRKMSMQLLEEANEKIHHMDIYFLFGLMDACNMTFEENKGDGKGDITDFGELGN